MICPKCKKTIKDNSKVCGYCGKKLATTLPVPVKKEQPVPKEEQSPNVARCPMCGSTSLQAQKQGFKFGRAVIGTLIAGPLVGAVTGGAGANNLQIICLNCGYQFMI